jgi:hypothetical protein
VRPSQAELAKREKGLEGKKEKAKMKFMQKQVQRGLHLSIRIRFAPHARRVLQCVHARACVCARLCSCARVCVCAHVCVIVLVYVRTYAYTVRVDFFCMCAYLLARHGFSFVCWIRAFGTIAQVPPQRGLLPGRRLGDHEARPVGCYRRTCMLYILFPGAMPLRPLGTRACYRRTPFLLNRPRWRMVAPLRMLACCKLTAPAQMKLPFFAI